MVRTFLAGMVLATQSVASAPPSLVRVNETPGPLQPLVHASGPYRNGRLVSAAFVELAGSPKQIDDIKAYAVLRGWRIDCELIAGSMSTLRLRFLPGTSQFEIEAYFDTDIRLPARASKISMVYDKSRRSPGCVTLP